MKRSPGLTLVETLVTTIVLSIVILAAGTVYLSAVKDLQRLTDIENVQAEAIYAVDHIYDNLKGAVGIDTMTADSIVVNVWEGPIDGPPRTLKKIGYFFNSAASTVDFYDYYGTASQTIKPIAKYITSLQFSRPLTTSAGSSINNYVTIDVSVRKGSNTGRVMNEALSTGVVLRGMPTNG